MEGHFSQRVYVVPSLGLVAVRFGEDRLDWDEAALMNGIIEALKPPLDLPSSPPRPDHAFGERPAPRAPDYAQRENWARYPDSEAAIAPEQAVGFYIHPTTWPGREWNANPADQSTQPGVDAVVASQASVLDACCTVYAPRYRQAASAAVFDPADNGEQAYGLAFTDVLRAFNHVAERTEGRPIVILGHSQGGLHTRRLVSDIISGNEALKKRLVAAYVAGIPIPLRAYEDQLSEFKPCQKRRRHRLRGVLGHLRPARRRQVIPDVHGDTLPAIPPRRRRPGCAMQQSAELGGARRVDPRRSQSRRGGAVRARPGAPRLHPRRDRRLVR